jgi:hypothetical protein
VFVSGYVVSKLDRFLEGSLFENGKPTVQWVPLGLFAAAFILSTILVFVNRVYTDDVTRFSVLSFTAQTGNSEMVLGSDKLEIRDQRLIINGTTMTNVTVEAGDFIKITPRTRDLEINGKPAGSLPHPAEQKPKGQ